MATKTIVKLEDDIDGGAADETLNFAFDGRCYVIDLSAENADLFRSAVAPFVAAARREGGGRAARPAKSTGRSDIAEIRAWAKENGYAVSERGRIAREIQEAYDAA